jgi:hypothetical protein
MSQDKYALMINREVVYTGAGFKLAKVTTFSKGSKNNSAEDNYIVPAWHDDGSLCYHAKLYGNYWNLKTLDSQPLYDDRDFYNAYCNRCNTYDQKGIFFGVSKETAIAKGEEWFRSHHVVELLHAKIY